MYTEIAILQLIRHASQPYQRNRPPVDNDGQRANCGDRRLISGCRMVSRPPGGQSRGVSSPGFPRPSGFGHPGLCLSRPPDGPMQSSLQAAVGSSGFSLPYAVQALACRRYVCRPGFSLPYAVQAHLPGILQGRRNRSMACLSIGGRLRYQRVFGWTMDDGRWTMDAGGQ